MYFVLLFLLLDCFFCTITLAEKSTGFDLFTSNDIIGPYDAIKGNAHLLFASPSLVEVNGVIVAIAESYSASNGAINIEILVKDVQLKDGELSQDIAMNVSNWNLQKLVASDPTVYLFNAMRPTAVVKDDTIYVFYKKIFDNVSLNGEYDYYNNDNEEQVEPKVDFQIIVGKVKVFGDTLTKKLVWETPRSLGEKFKKTVESHGMVNLIGSANSGVVLNNQTLVFPVMYESKSSKLFSTVIFWHIGAGVDKFEFVPSTLPAYCLSPSIVEWEGKLFMMVFCKKSYRKVYESTDVGKTWTEVAVLSSHALLDTNNTESAVSYQRGFITAEINGAKVILFTLPVKTKYNRYMLNLWMFDGKRVYDAGTIAEEDFNTIPLSALLYTKEMLYLLYECIFTSKNKVVERTLYFTALSDKLKKINFMLEVWKKQDNSVLKKCAHFADNFDIAKRDCAAFMPSNGIVGLLSNNGNNTAWNDEYLFVDATVVYGIKVKNGFTFIKAGSGAIWPVGEKNDDSPYSFINYNFTLIATVAIHRVSVGVESPVLGVMLKNLKNNSNSKVLFGLSYGKKKEWKLVKDSNTVLLNEPKWVLWKSYHVALILNADKGSIYIDWQQFGSEENITMDRNNWSISHFYFGAYSDYDNFEKKETYVTITDVFLYNRPFNKTEIYLLKSNKNLKMRNGRNTANCINVGVCVLLLLGLQALLLGVSVFAPLFY